MSIIDSILLNFDYALPIILIIGILINLCFYKFITPMYKWIFYYLLIMLCVDVGARIYGQFGSNLILLPIYSVIEVIIITIFYYKFLFEASHRLVKGLCFIASLYILWEIIILIGIETSQFQSYAKVADNFVVVTLTLAYFHEKIYIFKESKWDNFQFNTVVLVYFFLNMIFFLPINFLINESTGLKFYFWFGTNILTLLFYSYLTHSIWKNGRTRKLLPSGSR